MLTALCWLRNRLYRGRRGGNTKPLSLINAKTLLLSGCTIKALSDSGRHSQMLAAQPEILTCFRLSPIPGAEEGANLQLGHPTRYTTYSPQLRFTRVKWVFQTE
jgi:hypothetical protein